MAKTFISAGAGSGKTYRITTDVAKMVFDHKLNPDQVIMTTFTKAAAQELREKAKKELVNLGKHREAQQMEHALIGTVHSVANTFLTKYWYLLGIMPDAAAMGTVRIRIAYFIDGVSATDGFLVFKLMSALRCYRIEHSHCLGHNLGADTVTL